MSPPSIRTADGGTEGNGPRRDAGAYPCCLHRRQNGNILSRVYRGFKTCARRSFASAQGVTGVCVPLLPNDPLVDRALALATEATPGADAHSQPRQREPVAAPSARVFTQLRNATQNWNRKAGR